MKLWKHSWSSSPKLWQCSYLWLCFW